MSKSSFQLIVLLTSSLFAASASADATECPAGAMKVLVAPFENAGSQKTAIAAYSFGFAAVVAESLEADPCIQPVAGPLVLTEGLMALYTPQGKIKDKSKLEEFARNAGATHMLTGQFSGPTSGLQFEMHLSGVSPAGAEGSAFQASYMSTADLLMDFTTSRGVVVKDISMYRIHEMLSVAAETVFSSHAAEESTPVLAPETVAALATPGTNQAYAFLKLARAYARYFAFDLPEERYVASLKNWEARAKYFARRAKHRNREKITARGLAATAVNMDPAYGAAQRFYAFHVEKSGKQVKARFHYELAAKARIADVRSLMSAGRLEMTFGNYKSAIRHFQNANKVSRRNADTSYMLGLAGKADNNTELAMTSFIAARNIRPAHVDARRELAELYSTKHQDIDASAEYREILRYQPENIAIAFKHAASLRAAGRLNGAERRLRDYAESFPNEPRFLRFRADVLTMLGRIDEARAVYGATASMAKTELRAKAMADNLPSKLLGGTMLLEAMSESAGVAAQLEHRRQHHQLALTDAVLDLQHNGGEACKDGRGASSALLAMQEREAHKSLGRRLDELTKNISAAFRSGEDAALTTNEITGVKEMLGASVASRRDTMEMAGLYSRTFLPLYNRFKCGEYDGEIRAATISDVRSKNVTRGVKRTEAGWLPKPMAFSPRITPMEARIIRFIVDNTDGRTDTNVSIDGTFIGTVAKGAKATFNARAGVHRICLVAENGNCQDDDAEHTDYIREGWKIRIRS